MVQVSQFSPAGASPGSLPNYAGDNDCDFVIFRSCSSAKKLKYPKCGGDLFSFRCCVLLQQALH